MADSGLQMGLPLAGSRRKDGRGEQYSPPSADSQGGRPPAIANAGPASRLPGMFKPKQIREFIHRHRVDDGSTFRLRDHDPGDTGRLKSEDKDEAKEGLQEGVKWLAETQDWSYF